MLKLRLSLALISALCLGLAGCASNEEQAPVVVAPEVVAEATPVTCRSPGDVQKIGELERQMTREQRQCNTEKRRLEQALKESQKQNEEQQKKLDDLQKKLDGLLSIDRDLRNRSRSR